MCNYPGWASYWRGYMTNSWKEASTLPVCYGYPNNVDCTAHSPGIYCSTGISRFSNFNCELCWVVRLQELQWLSLRDLAMKLSLGEVYKWYPAGVHVMRRFPRQRPHQIPSRDLWLRSIIWLHLERTQGDRFLKYRRSKNNLYHNLQIRLNQRISKWFLWTSIF